MALAINWAEQNFELHPERAVHWPAGRTLIIADPHFGKAAAYRSRGVPVPAGTTRDDLGRLSRLIERTAAARLLILGDFLHSRDGRAEATMSSLESWRNEHAALEILLVRGNHDHHAGDPPESWGIICVDEPYIEGDLAFRHTPAAPQTTLNKRSKQRFTFAGHVHPCAVLHDVDGSTIRAACFFFSKREAMLPAFGRFTGAHRIRPQRGDRVFAIGEECVIEVRGI